MLDLIMWVLVIAALTALIALGFLGGVLYYGGVAAVKDVIARVSNLFKRETK